MKLVVVLRHAKTELTHPRGDLERALTDRGRSDASAAASAIAQQGIAPDCIVSSSAVRAVQTANVVAAHLGIEFDIIEIAALYLSSADQLLHEIQRFPEECSTVILVAHNPGMLDLVNLFFDEHEQIDRLPTSGFAIVEGDVEQWSEFSTSGARVKSIQLERLG